MAPTHPDPLAPAPIDPSAAAGLSQRPTASSPLPGGATSGGGGGVDVGMLLQKVALAGMSNMVSLAVDRLASAGLTTDLERRAGETGQHALTSSQLTTFLLHSDCGLRYQPV